MSSNCILAVPQSKDIYILIGAVVALSIVVVLIFITVIVKNHLTKAKRTNELMKAVLDTQESERVRIAEELHDAIGMRLGSIKIHLRMLKNAASIETHDQILEDARILVEAANTELRVLVRNLFPRIIEQHGLYEELLELKRQVDKLKILNLELIYPENFPKLQLEAEVNIYRVLQELCNNALKYSMGTKAIIKFKYDEHDLIISFEDNGKGYKFENNITGSGLRNIKNRIALYEGKITFTSNPSVSNLLSLGFERKKIEKLI